MNWVSEYVLYWHSEHKKREEIVAWVCELNKQEFLSDLCLDNENVASSSDTQIRSDKSSSTGRKTYYITPILSSVSGPFNTKV